MYHVSWGVAGVKLAGLQFVCVLSLLGACDLTVGARVPPQHTAAPVVDSGDTGSSGTLPTGATGDTGTPFVPESGLIITEVMESGPVKFVELYNPGADAVALVDYELLTYFNGAYTPQSTMSLGEGTVAGGSVWVIANDSDAFAGLYGQHPHADHGTAIAGNGNDSYVLQQAKVGVVDVYGAPGTDGVGQLWDYTDQTARRAPAIQDGSAVWIASEWVLQPNTKATPGVR